MESKRKIRERGRNGVVRKVKTEDAYIEQNGGKREAEGRRFRRTFQERWRRVTLRRFTDLFKQPGLSVKARGGGEGFLEVLVELLCRYIDTDVVQYTQLDEEESPLHSTRRGQANRWKYARALSRFSYITIRINHECHLRCWSSTCSTSTC